MNIKIQVINWRLSPWIFLLKMYGQSIIDSVFYYSLFYVYSFSFIFNQHLCWEWCKNLAVCGCRDQRQLLFLKKSSRGKLHKSCVVCLNADWMEFVKLAILYCMHRAKPALHYGWDSPEHKYYREMLQKAKHSNMKHKTRENIIITSKSNYKIIN